MENPEEINQRELMEYYEYEGKIGELKLKYQLLRSWFFQFLASLSPSSNLAVLFQRARGVKIGRHVYLGPNVHLDLLYPQLITIEDFVSIGMNTMIFVHSNPTNSIHIKKYEYPRKITPVAIKKGTWVAPGCIILAGVTIGEYAVVGAGSLVTKDVPPLTVVAGVPAKPVKELTNIKEIIAINRSKFLHARAH